MKPADCAANLIVASAGAGDETPEVNRGSDARPVRPEPVFNGSLDGEKHSEHRVVKKRRRPSPPREMSDEEWLAQNPPPAGCKIEPEWFESMSERMKNPHFSQMADLWDHLSKADQGKLVELVVRIIPVVGTGKSSRGAPRAKR